MTDIDDTEIADGIKDACEEGQSYNQALRDVEDTFLDENSTETERMVLRAWLLGHDIVHIQHHDDGSVCNVMGIETVDDEPTPDMGERVDRYDLRDCESPAEVLGLLNL